MVDRVGCGDVAGRGRDRGQGAGKHKSRQENRIWGKGKINSVWRERGGGGGVGRKDTWGRWLGRIYISGQREDWGGRIRQGIRDQGAF